MRETTDAYYHVFAVNTFLEYLETVKC